MINVLLIDDDTGFTEPVSMYLSQAGCKVATASTVKEGIALIGSAAPDIIILDLNLKGESGLKLLEYIAEKGLDIPVAVLTGHASLDSSVKALRLRAVDYLMKPIPLDELLVRIKSMAGVKYGDDSADPALPEHCGIVGKSRLIMEVLAQIKHAGNASHNVLITGESGTGKELVAKAIHDNSDRRKGPFVTVNCAALGETLFHGELFGYKKGSYTGAVASHRGYLKVADTGSLLLDEIGEIPVNSQVKLLRVLETGEFNPIGETHPVKIDVRFIAATNRDIKKEVEAGNFRLDLYYRLNIFHIHIPPLRERPEDVPLLAGHFLHKHRDASRCKARGFSQEALDRLSAYSWPGNVRQLQGAVLRALAHCRGNEITADQLPELGEAIELAAEPAVRPAAKMPRLTMKEAAKEILLATLAEANGNVTIAADMMGINRATLYRKLAKYSIDVEKYRSDPPECNPE